MPLYLTFATTKVKIKLLPQFFLNSHDRCDTSEKKQGYRKVIHSTIFIKCENKLEENIVEVCKKTFSKEKSSTQDFQYKHVKD